MPIIKPKLSKQRGATKNAHEITLGIRFDIWTEILAQGEPKEVIGEILRVWYTQQLEGKETYFTENINSVTRLKTNPFDASDIPQLKNAFYRAVALGYQKRADQLGMIINSLGGSLDKI
jgi:hypothetical protein